MSERRLEEVLDECLSAYLDGRRTIEQSLSLYPSLRDQLEPLLRTAIDVAETFRAPSPVPPAVERGRERFLDSASARRRADRLTEGLGLSRRLARVTWGRAQLALLAAAFLVTFVTVAAATTALAPSSTDGPQAHFIPATEGPAVAGLRQAQEQLRLQTIDGGTVTPHSLRRLSQETAALESQVDEFATLDAPSQLALQRALGYQFLLLHLIVDTQPPAAILPAATEPLTLTQRLAAKWGVDLPEPPSAAPAPPASPSPGATPSADASHAPSLAASPAPTAARRPAPPTP